MGQIYNRKPLILKWILKETAVLRGQRCLRSSAFRENTIFSRYISKYSLIALSDVNPFLTNVFLHYLLKSLSVFDLLNFSGNTE